MAFNDTRMAADRAGLQAFSLSAVMPHDPPPALLLACVFALGVLLLGYGRRHPRVFALCVFVLTAACVTVWTNPYLPHDSFASLWLGVAAGAAVVYVYASFASAVAVVVGGALGAACALLAVVSVRAVASSVAALYDAHALDHDAAHAAPSSIGLTLPLGRPTFTLSNGSGGSSSSGGLFALRDVLVVAAVSALTARGGSALWRRLHTVQSRLVRAGSVGLWHDRVRVAVPYVVTTVLSPVATLCVMGVGAVAAVVAQLVYSVSVLFGAAPAGAVGGGAIIALGWRFVPWNELVMVLVLLAGVVHGVAASRHLHAIITVWLTVLCGSVLVAWSLSCALGLHRGPRDEPRDAVVLALWGALAAAGASVQFYYFDEEHAGSTRPRAARVRDVQFVSDDARLGQGQSLYTDHHRTLKRLRQSQSPPPTEANGHGNGLTYGQWSAPAGVVVVESDAHRRPPPRYDTVDDGDDDVIRHLPFARQPTPPATAQIAPPAFGAAPAAYATAWPAPGAVSAVRPPPAASLSDRYAAMARAGSDGVSSLPVAVAGGHDRVPYDPEASDSAVDADDADASADADEGDDAQHSSAAMAGADADADADSDADDSDFDIAAATPRRNASNPDADLASSSDSSDDDEDDGATAAGVSSSSAASRFVGAAVALGAAAAAGSTSDADDDDADEDLTAMASEVDPQLVLRARLRPRRPPTGFFANR